MSGKGEVMIGCMEGARGEMRGREEGTRGGSSVGQIQKEERGGGGGAAPQEEGRGRCEGKGRRSTTTQPHTRGSRVSRKKNVSSSNTTWHLESESRGERGWGSALRPTVGQDSGITDNHT